MERQERTGGHLEASLQLNAFDKDHVRSGGTVAQQQKEFDSKIARQQKQVEALTAGLQKVSAQVDMSRPAPQMVLNDQ